MTLPGATVTFDDQRTPTGPNLQLSTVFLTGELTKGPDTPTIIRSLRELQRGYGDRTADTAAVHDWVDAFFKEGGGRVYVTPLRGPAAAKATHTFNDTAPAAAIVVTAKTAGTDGNRTSIDIDAGGAGGTFAIKVLRDGVVVETSGDLADGAAAAAWAVDGSSWVNITDDVGGDPAPGSVTALTGGDDDFDGITTTEIQDALDLFIANLGPGSVVLPGRTATSAQLIAQTHASTHNRLARHAFVASSNAATVAAQLATLRAGEGADVGDPLGPRQNMPGLTAVTSRTVEATVLRCAAEARNDRDGISPNQPAAGNHAIAQYLTSETVTWTDEDLELLNDAGGNVVRTLTDGRLKVFGARTLANPASDPVALRIGSARLRMAVAEIGRFHAEQFAFTELDPGGIKLGYLEGFILGALDAYHASFFALTVDAELVAGDAPGEYVVEVAIEFQASPDAERVRVTISRSLTEVTA